ncbi:MAG: hypothetical protein ABIP55_17305 [Tepidisphaeraceae bacterium]
MKANLEKRLTAMILAVLALTLVSAYASRALACEPEPSNEEFRVDGELPGGG